MQRVAVAAPSISAPVNNIRLTVTFSIYYRIITTQTHRHDHSTEKYVRRPNQRNDY